MITAGGIIIPNSVDVKSGYLKATVLAVGIGAKTKKGHLKPLDVKVGDTILFQRHVSVKVEFNSEELYILNESNVLGIA
jgi:chaperonin GroES